LHDTPEPPPNRETRLSLHDVFAGPDGLRAGWGLLLFVLVWQLLRLLLHPLVRSLVPGAAHSAQPMPPLLLVTLEAASLLCVAASTWVLAHVEGRRFRDYGLNDARGGRHLWAGAAWGAALLSILVLCLRGVGALAFDGWQLSGLAAAEYAAVWVVGFLLVSLFEELLFRGYVQYTIARGIHGICSYFGLRHAGAIGFWTAALLTSFYFGFGHGSNAGESPIGLISAGLIALVFCFSIWRTGSLWWAIGFHAAWDWMQSFFYGVGDSGSMIQGHLLATHPMGRALVSGGVTGPEGSILNLPVIALAACAVFFTLPRINRDENSAPYTPSKAAAPADVSLH